MTVEHQCGEEYWQHCLFCVVGDPDAFVYELVVDDSGLCTYARVQYPDGSETFLVRESNGWRSPEGAPPYDAATKTGMYD